jgi:hypothetical protein
MRILQYGFFGEDAPQKIFLDNYLNRLNQEHKRSCQFRGQEQFNQLFQGRDRNGVKHGVGIAAEQGLGLPRFKLDCLFVGLDLDSNLPTIYEHEARVVREKIPESLRSRTLLMLPMQCIEHWVLYVKRGEHQAESLEALSNRAVQEELYGGKIASSRKKEVVQELTKDLRINWLANRSPTFNFFNQQVKKYLSNTMA